jgi:hypothetical protein
MQMYNINKKVLVFSLCCLSLKAMDRPYPFPKEGTKEFEDYQRDTQKIAERNVRRKNDIRKDIQIKLQEAKRDYSNSIGSLVGELVVEKMKQFEAAVNIHLSEDCSDDAKEIIINLRKDMRGKMQKLHITTFDILDLPIPKEVTKKFEDHQRGTQEIAERNVRRKNNIGNKLKEALEEAKSNCSNSTVNLLGELIVFKMKLFEKRVNAYLADEEDLPFFSGINNKIVNSREDMRDKLQKLIVSTFDIFEIRKK